MTQIKAQREAARRYAQVMIETASQGALMRLYYERLLLNLRQAQQHLPHQRTTAHHHLRQAERILHSLQEQFRTSSSPEAQLLYHNHSELKSSLQHLFLQLHDNGERFKTLLNVITMYHTAWLRPTWELSDLSEEPPAALEA
jgi:flagellin-specific chaperone FliS